MKHYEKLHEQKQSKKAFNISKKLFYFLEKIISKRLSDVDSKIRDISFELTEKMLIELESEIISESFLNKLVTPLFEEDIVIVEKTLGLLFNLLTKCKKPNEIVRYLVDKKDKLFETCRVNNYAGIYSMKIIGLLHSHAPEHNFINKNLLLNLLETFAK